MGVKVKEWKGAWWIFVNHNGQRKAKRVGTGKEGKKAALAAAEKIEAKLTLGDLGIFEASKPQPVTLQEYADQWLRTDVEVRLKPATLEKYRQVLHIHWLPELGRLPLSAISREQVKEVLQRKLLGGLKPNVMRSRIGILRTCLNAALEEGLISENPTVRLGKFFGRARTEVEIFAREELSQLLKTAERELPMSFPVVLTLARTGLRVGECLTLQIGDVDFEGRGIHVRRTWGLRTRSWGTRRINTPKSGHARRVDMSRQLSEVLQAYLATQRGGALASEWLFPGEPGWPMTPAKFRESIWLPLLRRSGVPYRKPHALRHTFASLLIQLGESPDYVKQQLGHASITTTMDTYAHWIPGTNTGAVDRLDDAPTGRNPRATSGRPRLRLVRGGQG